MRASRAYRFGAIRLQPRGNMSDLTTIQIVAHRRNINRYRALLRTELTKLERDFIVRRIAEEEAELRTLRTQAVA